MLQKLQKTLSFLLPLITILFISCEKEIPSIPDTETQISYQSSGEGKVVFTSVAPNANTYEWDFGDGSTKSPDANPTHEYAKNGNYTVIFIAKNSKNQIVKTLKISIGDAPKPVSKFTYKNLGDAKIDFVNDSQNGETFVWYFGNGDSSNTKSVQYQYKLNGNYQVKLVAKSVNGISESVQSIAIIDAIKPTAKFSFKSLGNGLIAFSNESLNADSYVWSFGNGSTSTDKNPENTYLVNGTYEIKLVAKNYNGETEYKQTLTVADAPKPSANFSYTYGSNGSVYFTNLSANATSYQWSFGNGQTSTLQSPSVTYSSNTNYSVTLTAKNANGENTAVKTVSISSVPTTGSVIFWSQVSKNILIYVNGNYKGTNTKYMLSNTVPSCGLSGFVTVTLPQGAYSFTAQTEGLFPTKWSGVINVTNGNCGNMQLTK